MQIHFIAIGGSAMHNLAIALKKKGCTVTGSDDEIFEPSYGRLKAHGLLPKEVGWNPERITNELDAVVLGMHACTDNPELIKAKELGVKIYSYPEYLFEQTKGKTRVVIGGSHGKTTITSMLMHVLRGVGVKFDYMVGAQLEGFDTMVSLSEDTAIAVFEGDEYLTSPIDPRPKFLLYKPNIALISGIAWDHINAFPTYDIYREQFKLFVESIEPGGHLVYCQSDPEVKAIATLVGKEVSTAPYTTHPFTTDDGQSSLRVGDSIIPVRVIGSHNMENIAGAKGVCNLLGISDADFYHAIATFAGASRRLEVLGQSDSTTVFNDFAHSPSKVKATVSALRMAYPNRRLVACLELHTFSSLNPEFLGQFKGALADADEAFVFFNPKTIEHKGLPPLSREQVTDAFGSPTPEVYTDSSALIATLHSLNRDNCNLLIMTSGNFSGVNLKELASSILGKAE